MLLHATVMYSENKDSQEESYVLLYKLMAVFLMFARNHNICPSMLTPTRPLTVPGVVPQML